jgi:hypothetical protein
MMIPGSSLSGFLGDRIISGVFSFTVDIGIVFYNWFIKGSMLLFSGCSTTINIGHFPSRRLPAMDILFLQTNRISSDCRNLPFMARVPSHRMVKDG